MFKPGFGAISDTAFVAAMVDAAMNTIKTCIPAKVQSFNPVTCRVEVKPMVALPGFIMGLNVEAPKIQNIPLIYPRGKNYCIQYPVQTGDVGLLFTSANDLRNWKLGLPQTDDNTNRFDFVNSFFLPGVFSLLDPQITPPYDGDNLAFTYDLLHGITYGAKNEGLTIKSGAMTQVDVKDDTVIIKVGAQTTVTIKDGEVEVAASNLKLTGAVEITDTLKVTGAVEFEDTLKVGGDTEMSGAAKIGDALTVSGDITGSGGLKIGTTKLVVS